jgi:hypothetical protein
VDFEADFGVHFILDHGGICMKKQVKKSF